MTTKQATEILSEINKWRRGEGKYEKPGTGSPYPAITLGEAIDTAVNALKTIQQCYDNTCSVEHFLRTTRGIFGNTESNKKKTLDIYEDNSHISQK